MLQLASRLNLKYLRRFIFLLFLPHICFPWGRLLTNCLAACTHLSSTVSQLFEPQVQKIVNFTYSSPHFCFPWRRPCDYHAICCMDGKTIQCLPNSSQYVPIYLHSFRVIRCLSQCVSPKIAIFTTFLFFVGTPLR